MAMKRTQLYLDETTARALAAISREKKTTVSELVRESIRAVYGSGKTVDRPALARQIAGIWKNRQDLKHPDRTVRRLRRGTRSTRFGLE
ncbi:MAG TPA: CopG family transcriptional regulator [Acidobacteriota bacterium]|jgi:hypothetical protein